MISVFNTLQAFLGDLQVNDFNRFVAQQVVIRRTLRSARRRGPADPLCGKQWGVNGAANHLGNGDADE